MTTDPNTRLVALAGQQNAGKSTLFNTLTGARQQVANYPGVTVDKQSGRYRDDQGEIHIVDLPGTYSLTSFSLEERVAREFLLQDAPDVVVNVLDAANLRRSLHLTLQLMELERPLVLAVNMLDVAAAQGLELHLERLAERLGVPVVGTVGRKGEGRAALRAAIREGAARPGERHPIPVTYGALEARIGELEQPLAAAPALADLPRRWLALKLLEDDAQATHLLVARLGEAAGAGILAQAAQARAAFEAEQGVEIGDHVAGCRQHSITALLDGVLTRTARDQPSITDRIDRFVLNRWVAPGFLVLTVWLIYQLSIVWGYEPALLR